MKTLEKTWESEDEGFLLELQNYEIEWEDNYKEETEEKGDEEELPMIQALLKQYANLIKTPKGLPLKRAVDQRIITLSDRRPINVRPYKYSHVQKEEIEKLVIEMLHVGMIRSSHNPYSSMLLMVKKKDRGWRLCVNYRKLNQVIVSDKFPKSC